TFPHFLCLPFCFFFPFSRHLPDLHSFPTRRSSDLWPSWNRRMIGITSMMGSEDMMTPAAWTPHWHFSPSRPFAVSKVSLASGSRSEEHTSELQSRFDLVCRLLLEKKNHILLVMSH